MPELPEVETVRRDLNKLITGKPIAAVSVLHAKTVRILPKIFIKKMHGQLITNIDRIGKLLIFNFKFPDQVLLVHLKMTGQLIFRSGKKVVAGGHSLSEPIKELPNKHTRVIVTFNDSSELFFNDLRLFGYMELVDESKLVKVKAGYGIEPLTKNFTLNNFQKVLKNRRTSIKALLLNQKIISGLGNIYVDEACFLAGIKPTRVVTRLTAEEVKQLWQACIEVIKLGVKHRGTTFNHFVDGNGEKGGFLPFLKVYGRAGKPCKTCKTSIAKIKAVGRGTHFCPQCQT